MNDNETHNAGDRNAQDEQADAVGDEAESGTGNEGLGALAKDVAHPFDQTNGIVDGLEGDEDDPEKMDEKLDHREDGSEGRVVGIPIAGMSGGQPGVAPAPVFGSEDGSEDEAHNSDTDDPQGP